MTVDRGNKRAGLVMRERCWNNRTPPADTYLAQDGHLLENFEPDGARVVLPRFIEVVDRMSKLCRQPGGQTPNPGCVGCKHLGEDVDYENRMRGTK